MQKQLFEVPTIDVPYFHDLKDTEKRENCKKCKISGEAWADFVRGHSQSM